MAKYPRLLPLIAVAIVAGATTLGGKLNTMFSNLGGSIEAKTPTTAPTS